MRLRSSLERGQVLPLALVGCLLLLATSLFLFHGGRLLLKRAQVRARVDLTALSAGVDYARSLNILAFSEKVYAASEALDMAVDLAAAFSTGGLSLAATAAKRLSGNSLPALIAKLQNLFLTAAPWAVAASSAHIGFENGLLGVPSWNQGEGSVFPNADSLKPDLNVDQEGLLQQQVQNFLGASKAGEASALGGSNEEFSQRQRRSRRRIRMGASEVEQIRIRRKGRTVTAWRHKKTKKFVARRAKKQIKSDIPAEPKDLVDLGEHSITLWVLSREDKTGVSRALPRMGAVSKVRVAGGNMDLWSTSSSEYAPYFVPLREAEAKDGEGFPRLSHTGFAKVDKWIERINATTALFSGEGVLH